MDHTNIYALKGSTNWFDISSSLRKGVGRFGWSYIETADLNELKRRKEENGLESLSNEEKDCFQKFLLDLKDGDYVVYINIPKWGKCTIGKVTGPYYWEFNDKDFNHRFPVDPESVYEFDRNDNIVHPALSSRFKLQGRWWNIYLKNEFKSLLQALNDGYSPKSRSPEDNLRALAKDIEPFLVNITNKIQHRHPNYDLEFLLADVFKNIPQVIDVKRQGGAGDKGADILINYSSGLPIPGLEKEITIVVQVKSYVGSHWDTKAVNDIERAFKAYPEAEMGLIISTASESTEALETELDRLKEKVNKPIAVLIGSDVASFILRFGAKLLA